MSSKGDSELDKSGQRYILCFLTNFNVLSRKIYISRGLKWAPLTRLSNYKYQFPSLLI